MTPCPLLANDREQVEHFFEQWGMPIGTSHWRIDQTMAWKMGMYVAWLQSELEACRNPITK